MIRGIRQSAVSFWYKREFLNCRVLLTSSLGERYIDYKFTTGTHSVDGSGNVTFYLGSMPTTDWTRFERNIEEDFEAVSSGTWTSTDGLYIRIPETLGSEDTLLDDIRLSDSVTVKHNTLGPGVIGHILRNTTWNYGSGLAREDRWFHYDQVGSALSVSDETGDLAMTHQQDAFGNVMAGWASGIWGSGTSGWHFQTKMNDTLETINFVERWYIREIGIFGSSSPIPVELEGSFASFAQNPTINTDPYGLFPSLSQLIRRIVLGGADQPTCATSAVLVSYEEMRSANWNNSDKYFHCKANCEAASCGSIGAYFAVAIDVGREMTDAPRNLVTLGFWATIEDAGYDMGANLNGLVGSWLVQVEPGCVDCRDACNPLRPAGLPARY